VIHELGIKSTSEGMSLRLLELHERGFDDVRRGNGRGGGGWKDFDVQRDLVEGGGDGKV
jgi:hypothetical protein